MEQMNKGANGYSLTIDGSLEVVQHLLNNKVAGGAYTPSQLLGAELVSRLPGPGTMVVE